MGNHLQTTLFDTPCPVCVLFRWYLFGVGLNGTKGKLPVGVAFPYTSAIDLCPTGHLWRCPCVLCVTHSVCVCVCFHPKQSAHPSLNPFQQEHSGKRAPLFVGLPHCFRACLLPFVSDMFTSPWLILQGNHFITGPISSFSPRNAPTKRGGKKISPGPKGGGRNSRMRLKERQQREAGGKFV